MHPLIQKYGFRSDFVRRYLNEAWGTVRALFIALDARGVAVTDDAREKIVACTDLEQLDTWVRRAANATKIDDLFE